MSRTLHALWAMPRSRRLVVGAAVVAALWLLSRTQAPLEARVPMSPARAARIAGGDAPEDVPVVAVVLVLAIAAVGIGLLLAWWSAWEERRRPIRRRTRWHTSKARIVVLVIAAFVAATIVRAWALGSRGGRYDESRLACALEPGQSFHQSTSSAYVRSASA